MLEKLRNQHATLRKLNGEFLVLLDNETPCDAAILAELRWKLVRTQLQHLALEQRCVYGPLARDPRPEVAAAAQGFIREWEATFAGIQDHSQHWTPERIESEWPAYSQSARQLVVVALDRMDREEAILYPMVKDGTPVPERTPDDHNWAANGRDMREQIGTASG